MAEKIEGEFMPITDIRDGQQIDLILNTRQISEVLKLIGNEVRNKGFIYDKKTGDRVTTPDLEEIKLKQVGAILPGSKVFIKKNIASFSRYLVESKKEEK